MGWSLSMCTVVTRYMVHGPSLVVPCIWIYNATGTPPRSCSNTQYAWLSNDYLFQSLGTEQKHQSKFTYISSLPRSFKQPIGCIPPFERCKTREIKFDWLDLSIQSRIIHMDGLLAQNYLEANSWVALRHFDWISAHTFRQLRVRLDNQSSTRHISYWMTNRQDSEEEEVSNVYNVNELALELHCFRDDERMMRIHSLESRVGASWYRMKHLEKMRKEP